MEWLWGAIAGAVASALIAGAQALLARSRRADMDEAIAGARQDAATKNAEVNKRVEAVEKDLLANYVSKNALDKTLEEMRRDSKRTLAMVSRIQLILARHFKELDLVKDDEA